PGQPQFQPPGPGRFDGVWETDSEAVNGRGSGHIQMTIAEQPGGLSFRTSTGYTYQCQLSGPRCVGTWTGRTGSGWFDIPFNGPTFAGLWGYGQDRAASASFNGHR